VKAVVLSSYPLVDRFAYKERLLRGLQERGFEVRLVYAAIAPADYAREALRRRPLVEMRDRLRHRGAPRPSVADARASKLRDAARDLGVDLSEFRSLGDDDCLRSVSTFAPDVVFNVSALYIPPPFLEAARFRVVGGHYGELPRLRGSDTVRWTILLDHPLLVSHQILGPELDMGDVVVKLPVEVRRGDDIGAVRRRCQEATAEGHLAVADRVAAGSLERKPQRREEGSTFFAMGRYLRGRVDRILAEGQYTHTSAEGLG
jgi:methionyl-tRNA formyltransferase